MVPTSTTPGHVIALDAGGGLGFLEEARHHHLVVEQRRQQQLDRDLGVELHVLRRDHDAHAAHAERLHHAVLVHQDHSRGQLRDVQAAHLSELYYILPRLAVS